MSRSSYTAASVIGQPTHFIQGEFAGQTIRATLLEIQQAELGRKYARKDRRPLDPPPVVEPKLYRVYNLGTEKEVELEINDHGLGSQRGGQICHVDLFPVSQRDLPDLSPSSGEWNSSRSQSQAVNVASARQAYGPSASATDHQPYPFASQITGPQFTNAGLNISCQHLRDVNASLGSDPLVPPDYLFASATDSGTIQQSTPCQQLPESDLVRPRGASFGEGTNCTSALSGATFSEAVDIEYQGRNRLMFVFPDLAVKMTGTFILRYRCFDLYARAESHGSEDLPILAECFGQPFRVYPTKDFPGLPPSTELTKHLARYGVRAMLRESERKRPRVQVPPTSTTIPVPGDLQDT
ncbi:hypothetical protein JAAARDRAFT_34581 [Jaapia argillacea MUCL 33604]|uniref:Velvet domain-containing protein n=1 Tax=Jaapia argillacea MUCL 33604 TaxID=933084 RepID=A0A067PVH1_9AGAM|nr:hypothetical protein JAAARDRAFT_34581 [Jaapia argillacea MUCL 33604]